MSILWDFSKISYLSIDQAYYLGFLPYDTDSSFTNGTLYPCEDCTTNGITLPENLPFGGYFHQQAFVSRVAIVYQYSVYDALIQTGKLEWPDNIWKRL